MTSVRLLAVFVAGVVMASGPQIAIAAFDAANADKVDGRHAVAASATKAARANKLVATNADGYLPADIILRVANSNQLDGLDSTAFQRRVTGTCAAGSSIRAIAAGGGVTCEPDTDDGGNAQLLDGKDSSEFQPVLDDQCATGEAVSGVSATGILCQTDAVDGGNAEFVDGIDSSEFIRTGANVVYIRDSENSVNNGQMLHDAYDNIANASQANPYVIYLEPGTYALGSTTLTTKPYVSLVGSGRGATKLTSTADAVSTQGAIRLSEGVEFSHLTLEHLPPTVTPPGTAGLGIDAGEEARLVDVAVLVSGPGDVYGLHVGFNAVVDIVGSTIAAGGVSGTDNEGVGVRADSSTLVTVHSSELFGGSADAPVGAAASLHGDSGTIEVENSSLRSSGAVVARKAPDATGFVRIANSKLDGTTTGTNGVICFDTYNFLFAPVTCS